MYMLEDFFFGDFMTAVSIILFVIIFVKLSNIKSRLDKLEQGKILQKQEVPAEAVQTNKREDKAVTGAPPHIIESTVSEPGPFEKFVAWYSHEWMLKTGALLILLGFVWLVSYAFMNNWIGPVGRITISLVIGALILAGGEYRLSKERTQGITLVWLGAAVLTVTVWAAQNMYHMFPPMVALLFLVATMIVTGFISLRHQSLSLAVAGLIISGVTPLLIGSTESNIFGLYSYLTAVTLGIIWLAQYSKWRVLTFLALIITALYSLTYFSSDITELISSITPIEFLQLRFFAATLTGIFFMVSLLTIITNKTVTTIDLITAGAVGLYTYGWINGLVRPEYKAVVTAAAALLYSGASFVTYTRTALRQPVYLYTAIAIILLAIATAFQFQGPVLVMAFSIQALLLPIIGVRLLGADIGKYILVYFILPVILSFSAIGNDWTTLFQNDFYALTIVTATLLSSGLYFYYDKRLHSKELHDGAIFFIIVGALYALLLVWKVFHVLFTPDYFAGMATLVVYTVVGLYSYIKGEIQKRKIFNRFGLFTLIFVIGRLLLFEVWQMELSGRIITFFVIGLLLIGSVLLRKNGTNNNEK